MKIPSSLLFAALFLIASCSKSDDKPANSRDLVYEFTGTYTGSITAAYTNANGSTVSELVNSLPWKKEIKLSSSVAGVGFSFSPVVAKPGVAGQAMTMRLSAGGKVKETLSGTADAMGYMVTFGTIAYVIQ
ncbi:hypothetical protein [Flavihumibacter sp. UBA7668]|uniref:hypothetical protein n=1 Tax=Flavihumibacter sp. UBA7668 TaxID=1946542 RepID=UPI0025C67B48|nr:hypothetical protein [Flavihumibacter sp. UBA7668]